MRISPKLQVNFTQQHNIFGLTVFFHYTNVSDLTCEPFFTKRKTLFLHKTRRRAAIADSLPYFTREAIITSNFTSTFGQGFPRFWKRPFKV